MFHAEIAEDPAGEHNEALQNDVLMDFPSAAAHVEDGGFGKGARGGEDDEGQEDERRKHRVEKQYGDDGVGE